MESLSFELARREHAKAIDQMRYALSADLTKTLGRGPWTGSTKIASVLQRISTADPDNLRRPTLYVACRNNLAVGSVVVSTYPPKTWKNRDWREPNVPALGVSNLAVFPELYGKAVGKCLMDGVEKLAQSHKIRFVRLDTHAKDSFSMLFYERLKYEERGVFEVRGVANAIFEKEVWSEPEVVAVEVPEAE